MVPTRDNTQHIATPTPLHMSANTCAVLSLHAWSYNALHNAGHILGSRNLTLQPICDDSVAYNA